MDLSLKQYRDLLVNYLRPQRGRVWLLAFLLFSNIGLQLNGAGIRKKFFVSVYVGALYLPEKTGVAGPG